MLLSSAMIPVYQVLPDTLAAILRKAPLTAEKVTFAWRQAVGPAIDRGTHVVLVGDILRVRVSSPAWRREVERSAPLIRARLDALLGETVVRRIEVLAETAAPPSDRPPDRMEYPS